MIYDITPLVNEDLPIWPGDVCYKRRLSKDMADGDLSTCSYASMTLHLGSHVDAPCHMVRDAESIDMMELDFYWNKCQVIKVVIGNGERIMPEHFGDEIVAPIVLFKTNTFNYKKAFQKNFAALSVEVVDFLRSKGVITIGIDTPSVDLFDSDPRAHRALFGNGMAAIEGLYLRGVDPGLYELSALPLKLEGSDASPVRAVLRHI